jgi:hypothetical protein
MGYFLWYVPMHKLVNPDTGEPLTGEPDAGDPPVRFGGRGSRSSGPPYPYQGAFGAGCKKYAALAVPAAKAGETPALRPCRTEIAEIAGRQT